MNRSKTSGRAIIAGLAGYAHRLRRRLNEVVDRGQLGPSGEQARLAFSPRRR
jgi:hypothetical protein